MPSNICYCAHCGAGNPNNEATCFACQQPLQPLEEMEEEREFLIGERYRLLAQIGSGGFSGVYKVADTQHNNAVRALKQTSLRSLSPQQIIEATDAFNREVALLSQLAHAHLPRIHDHFTDPEHWYLLLDFIEGETLEDYLERQPRPFASTQPAAFPLLTFAEIFDIALQLCDVLAYLHTRHPPIIFRDLKPSNIMRTPTGELYLIDFGIARHFKPGQQRDTMPFGSPGYAAPEQYGKAQTTPASDIYSLGALLHHLLSGQDPAETPFNFAPLHHYGPVGVTELVSLIQRMVTLNPEARPSSISEVSDELQRLAALQGIRPGSYARLARRTIAPQTVPPQPPYGIQQQAQPQVQVQRPPQPSPKKGLSRRRVLAAGLTISTIVIAGGVAAGALQQITSSQKALERNNGEPWKEPPQISDQTLIKLCSFSPDGQICANILYGDNITVWNPNTNWRLWNFYHAHLATSVPTWSPDSTQFATADLNGDIQIWDIEHRDRTHVISNPSPDLSETLQPYISWSPNGKYIAIAQASSDNQHYNPNIQIVEVTTNRVIAQCATVLGRVLALDWSPNSRYLAASTQQNVVQVWDITSPGKPRYNNTLSTSASDAGLALRWSPDGKRLATPTGAGHVALWNPFNNQQTRLEQADPSYTSSLLALEWSPDGKHLAAIIQNNGINIWDLVQQTSNNFAQDSDLRSLHWQSDSKSILVIDKYSNVTTLSAP